MSVDLENVQQSLRDVDKEIAELELKLNNAKDRKNDLLKRQADLESKVKGGGAPPPARQSAAGKKETPEELQARIAELQKQIQEAETQKKTKSPARTRGNTRSPSGRKLVLDADGGARGRQPGRGGGSQRMASPGKKGPAAAGSKPEAAPGAAAKGAAGNDKKAGGWKIFGRKKGKDDDAGAAADDGPSESAAAAPAPSPADAPPPPVAPEAQPAQATTTIKAGSKASTDWNRPDWAHAMTKQDDRAVDSDPIDNGLKEAQDSGYQRQVFAKDLDIQRGNFVGKQVKPPDPRLAWIVLRINDTGVPGKIVMHLYGKDIQALVDQFVGLKDTPVVPGGPNKASLTVQSDPPFYVTVLGGTGLEKKPGVYGVVREGHDIIDKILTAGEASFSVKQAHVFPVKKSKGGL